MMFLKFIDYMGLLNYGMIINIFSFKIRKKNLDLYSIAEDDILQIHDWRLPQQIRET